MASGSDKTVGTSSVISLDTQKRLVCIEYPAVVKNVGNMLTTLGGEEGVSKIYADPSKRLELYFRPKDPYCHPVCANRFPSTNMLLRVKKKTRKRKAGMSDAQQETPREVKFEMEIVGIVGSTFKFQGMSDFQYLAMHTGHNGEHISMYDKTLLWKLETEEFFTKDVPLFIPPPIFSRLDTPVDYYYRPDIQHR
ncbi:general transcription factor 3C polypeptide 5-like [Protopterus annectens]|uniref:general transcription factor 3C polypeptide 5-like n=1 Tax=Protopterus annectens TaxID=7888 RepID=UPI001CF9F6FA|nr:general transcription factor 3C polypeptide 5-like [Protopterus annectens]